MANPKPLARRARHSGDFKKGNKGGRTTKTAAQFRAWVESLRTSAVKEADVKEYWSQLIDGMRTGDKFFIREFGDRIYGKPKVEAEVTVNSNTTFEQRLVIARIAAGLIHGGTDAVPAIAGAVQPQLLEPQAIDPVIDGKALPEPVMDQIASEPTDDD